jgi:predicted Zn-dependent protease
MFRSLIVPIVLTVSALAQPADRTGFYSAEKEAALGAQLAKQFRQDTHALDSDAVQKYVVRIGGTLSAQTFTFTVIADGIGGSTHEVTAFPGGYLFVPASLLVAAHDEAEFAGMLAHAMAHVMERHGLRGSGDQPIVNYGSIPLVFLGGWDSGYHIGAGVPLGFLKALRERELEADRDAVRLMHAAGYDPRALVRYVGRVQRDGAAVQRSGMPEVAVRIANLESAVKALPVAEYRTGEDFSVIQNEVAARLRQR